MQSSRNLDVAVVAHDAGSARHIAAWISAGDLCGVREVVVDGPAISCFDADCLATGSSLQAALDRVDLLISGTGWASSLEHDARVMAREKNLRNIAVVDHWVNYRARFRRNDVEVLPDEIWVSDRDALELAQAEFQNIPVKQMPNRYLEEQLDKIAVFGDVEESSILYLMEPVRDEWVQGDEPGEMQAFRFFMENRPSLDIEKGSRVIIRPHPSDKSSKYASLLKEFSNDNVVIDKNTDLWQSLSQCNFVVGCQTYAMFVALEAGKRVVCSLPPEAPPCILPQTGILGLADKVKNK